ncbi:MAG: DUF58 domain-containing protein [Acidimicrobiia bacterium]|nr:DUF58 domain-containing protein [Acidimicrobiia bacterium]
MTVPPPPAPPPSPIRTQVTPTGVLAALSGGVGALFALGAGWRWALAIAAATTVVLIGDGWLSRRAVRPGRMALSMSGPSEVAVGDESALTLDVQSDVSSLVVGLPGLGVWARVVGRGARAVAVRHDRRGVFTHLLAVATHTAPLGLVGAHRSLVVGLAQPLHVVPRLITAERFPLPRTIADDPTATARRTQSPDLIRGAREYAPGDLVQRVHWPASAKAGKLMVREFDTQTSPTVVVVADLGSWAGHWADVAAGRTLWVVSQALRAGLAVQLATAEVGGVRIEPVITTAEAARRLAVALVGPPGLTVWREQGQLVTQLRPGRGGRRAVVWVSAQQVSW